MIGMIAALRDWRIAIALGCATIGAYGVASYSIGVLIEPIAKDTGWSTGSLSAAYATGILSGGAAAFAVGRSLDRVGSRPAFLVTLGVGAVLLFASASMHRPLTFALTWGLGSAAIGGGWFYQATLPTAARCYPARRAEAFRVLTLLGALASPIFYPLGGLLVDAFGWRTAVRLLVLAMIALVLPAAVFVNAPPAPGHDPATHAPRTSLRASIARPEVWRAMLAMALFGAAANSLILHQVPAMRVAGLSLAAASGYGGARGFMQIPARLVLTPLTRRLGVRRSLAVAYAAGMLGAAALLGATVLGLAPLFAVLFAITCGFCVGLLSPLHGLFAIEVYGEQRLGTLSGVQQVVTSLAGASAPWAAGWMVDVSGGYAVPLGGILAVQLLGLAALWWQRQAESATEAASEAAVRVTGAG
ncbi:MAG: MFS transporter [Dehalococcoidia bacterium]